MSVLHTGSNLQFSEICRKFATLRIYDLLENLSEFSDAGFLLEAMLLTYVYKLSEPAFKARRYWIAASSLRPSSSRKIP